MTLLLINSKNYVEASGARSVELAAAAETASRTLAEKSTSRTQSVQVVLAMPAFSIGSIVSAYPRLAVYSQHLDNQKDGSTTGYLVPEIARSFGASGSLLNHSEHRIPIEDTEALVSRMRKLGMTSVVCARDSKEVAELGRVRPDYIAIEPPELIGSGVAVSRARPEIITDSKIALDRTLSQMGGGHTLLLCGAGIVEPIDAQRAVELGAEGVLVASGVVKSKDWIASISGLARGLTAGKNSRQTAQKELDSRSADRV